MNPLAKFIKRFTNNSAPSERRHDPGWVNVALGGTYETFKSNDYENAYPSITKITNKFMIIRPYTIGPNGEETRSQLSDALYHPNIRNSSVEFREALALMYLVHPKTHVLVWRKEGNKVYPGGDITPENVAGFSILENVTAITVNGNTRYTITTEAGTATYTDQEVVTIRGLNPYAINSGGYSATRAARKWTTIDDYIAEYQKGFFENGAVPTGQFIITAATVQEYNDIVDTMQKRHRGASKNGNVTYTHRPVDKSSGKPVDAQIEWVPFATPNKELSLKDLFEQANNKIDSAFGVPASIRGVGENNNFATARTDQQNFMENVVDPIALKIWTQFTHEMNRITGGLGVAITYEIHIPALADEELVKSEKKKVDLDLLIAAKDAGFSISSTVAAFELPDDYNKLSAAEYVEEDDNNGDIDDGDEVTESPDPDQAGRNLIPTNIAGKDPNGIYAENGRYLGKKLGNNMVSIKNPTSKVETIVKV